MTGSEPAAGQTAAEQPPMEPPPLHPACRPLAGLLGVWRGQGRGEYPTIESFVYAEETTFSHVGKPFLIYSQKSRNPQTGQPMHAEFGFWRPKPDGRLEVVIAHNFGITEIAEGTYQTGAQLNQLEISLDSTSVGLASTAKQVDRVTRQLVLTENLNHAAAGLSCRLDMAAVGQPLQFHLEAELKRQD